MPVLKDGTPLKRGTFVVSSMLGRGGFGEVYLARQPRMDRDVAIKVLNPNLSDDAGVVERFQREALAAASLRHPNVLPVFDFDFDEDAGVWFLAMQYIPGGRTLKERLGAPMPPEEVVRLLAGVAGALDAAHTRGIVHRDVKPANVLMDGELPQLADFGIAHLGDMTGITATGMAIGTPVYMSPEQAMGKPVGPAADQYSLAVMAFEMLAGRPPFLGDSMSLVMQHVNAPPPTVSEYNASAAIAAAAVGRGLSKKPEERYPTCLEFVQSIVPGMAAFTSPSGGYAPSLSSRSSTPSSPEAATVGPATVGASASTTPGTVLVDDYDAATVASQPGVDVPAQDSRIEALREAEVRKSALPLRMPVMAGGAAALVVGILVVLMAVRGMSAGQAAQDDSASRAGGLTLQTGGGAIGSPAAASPTTLAAAVASPSRPFGTLRVDSNPTGAIILVNGEPASRTPRELNLEPGEHEITLQLPTFEDFVTKVDVAEGQRKDLSQIMKPKPAPEAITITGTTIGRDPYKDSFGMLRVQTPTDTFRLQDDINAVVYLEPKAKDIRDIPFKLTISWQRAGSSPYVQVVDYNVKKGDEQYIHACAPALAIDPQGSNRPLSLNVLADGEQIASFDFRISGGNPQQAAPSPCDETLIRGPVAQQPAPSPLHG